jgi:hypothetical protein
MRTENKIAENPPKNNEWRGDLGSRNIKKRVWQLKSECTRQIRMLKNPMSPGLGADIEQQRPVNKKNRGAYEEYTWNNSRYAEDKKYLLKFTQSTCKTWGAILTVYKSRNTPPSRPLFCYALKAPLRAGRPFSYEA